MLEKTMIRGIVLLVFGALLFTAPAIAEQTIRCKSDNFKYRYCRAQTDNRVTLVERYSETDCREGHSWGYDRGGVWVNRGCEAAFRVGRSRQDDYGRPSGKTLRCSSNDFQYRYCKARTNGQVELLRQYSDTRCQQGRNWGYDRGGIWVDRGCDAEFKVGRSGYDGYPGSSAKTIRCTSENYRYRHCRVPIRGDVELVRQYSDTRCREGRNWGYDRHGIWVNDGCDAEFRVGGRDDGGYAGPGDKRIRCTSDDYRYRYCSARTGERVTLVKQHSDTRCIQGRNWGYDRGGVWVDRGCDAEFELGGGRGHREAAW